MENKHNIIIDPVIENHEMLLFIRIIREKVLELL